jgi:hypothetical protein
MVEKKLLLGIPEEETTHIERVLLKREITRFQHTMYSTTQT